MHSYTVNFYKRTFEISQQSAREVIPLLLELFHPQRVVDVGCGIGVWLSVFKEYGINDIWGIDNEDIDREVLRIPKERFLRFDIREPSM